MIGQLVTRFASLMATYQGLIFIHRTCKETRFMRTMGIKNDSIPWDSWELWASRMTSYHEIHENYGHQEWLHYHEIHENHGHQEWLHTMRFMRTMGIKNDSIPWDSWELWASRMTPYHEIHENYGHQEWLHTMRFMRTMGIKNDSIPWDSWELWALRMTPYHEIHENYGHQEWLHTMRFMRSPSPLSPPRVRKHRGQRHYVGEDKYLPSAGFEPRKCSAIKYFVCAI